MDVLEPRQSEVREDFASQTPSANNQNLALASKERFDLQTLTGTNASAGIWGEDSVGLSYFFTGEEGRISSRARSIENLIYMVVSGFPVCGVCGPVQGHHSLVVLVIGVGLGEGTSQDRHTSVSHDRSVGFFRHRWINSAGLLVDSQERKFIAECIEKYYICITQAKIRRVHDKSARLRLQPTAILEIQQNISSGILEGD